MEKIKDSEMGSFFIFGGLVMVEYGVAILKITFAYFWPGAPYVNMGVCIYIKPPPHIYKDQTKQQAREGIA